MLRARSTAAASLAALLYVAWVPARASAFGIGDEKKGEVFNLEITNTAYFTYHFDDRNSPDTGKAAPSTIVDDTYGEWLDRFNIKGSYKKFSGSIRLDTATFIDATPSDAELYDFALSRAAPGESGVQTWDYVNSFKRELNTRFRNAYYPSKITGGYSTAGFELTLGDFYAQLGRGLVFSVRKEDDLASDTTVRGGKVELKKSSKDIKVSTTVFAGQMNPVRVDEISGRRLNGDGSPFFLGFPTGDDLVTYQFDELGHAGHVTDRARPNYLEDTIVGTSVEAGPKWLQIGAHSSWLFRKSYDREYIDCVAAAPSPDVAKECAADFPVFDTTNQARLHNRQWTFSGSLNFPKIGKIGEAYIEAAGQSLTDGRAIGAPNANGIYKVVQDRLGYAIYLSTTLRGGPITFNLEGKHYRQFFPLSANVNASGAADPSFAGPEFDTVAYSNIPTAEPNYVEQLGAPNLCITGAKAKVDYRMREDILSYAWLGHYVSFSEIDVNNFACDTAPELRTNTWDAAIGGEIEFDDGDSLFKAWVGSRTTDREVPAENASGSGATDVFYREGYVRYDITKHIKGDVSIQFQGLHRHRFEPLLTSDSWNEGENYTALHIAPYFGFTFGYEYLGRPGCTPDPDTRLCHYFSGGITFRAKDSKKWWAKVFDNASLFVGQRRGAIRCVSGVCRQFPPFEGARLEIVSRF
ncbi:MAG: hypothetical protein U0414_20705 [Polyangiaceae bacterium]